MNSEIKIASNNFVEVISYFLNHKFRNKNHFNIKVFLPDYQGFRFEKPLIEGLLPASHSNSSSQQGMSSTTASMFLPKALNMDYTSPYNKLKDEHDNLSNKSDLSLSTSSYGLSSSSSNIHHRVITSSTKDNLTGSGINSSELSVLHNGGTHYSPHRSLTDQSSYPPSYHPASLTPIGRLKLDSQQHTPHTRDTSTTSMIDGVQNKLNESPIKSEGVVESPVVSDDDNDDHIDNKEGQFNTAYSVAMAFCKLRFLSNSNVTSCNGGSRFFHLNIQILRNVATSEGADNKVGATQQEILDLSLSYKQCFARIVLKNSLSFL